MNELINLIQKSYEYKTYKYSNSILPKILIKSQRRFIMQINNEILHDFIVCHYKAYQKSKHQTGIISDYQLLYNQLKQKGKENFERAITKNNNLTVFQQNCKNSIPEEGISLNFRFTNANIDITLDGIEFAGKKNITPVFTTPFEKVTTTDKLFISLQALLIQAEFNLKIANCKVIHGKNLQGTQFKLSSTTKNIKKIITELNKMLSDSSEPTLILNKHCAICEYNASCKEKANADGNISLLDRATTKIIEKYKKKGIFTIQQLSYIYKPRRQKKRAKELFTHNLELQALAIRTDKIYAQQLPELSRQPIELFLDIEGNPDQELYYLIGVLIYKDNAIVTKSLWAETISDEAHVWQQFISITNEYPDAPIYHYGNYELKAIETLGKRYNTNVTQIQGCLINIVNTIYGKIYFPVYSNRLKELGNYLGFTW
ncbi:MAG: TM0106 family RecB-like putative nuclease, partial [Draconibacterium sp.]|nr:TM0106 family RecB-like putative nuclease [Draconibacterium sp.]